MCFNQDSFDKTGTLQVCLIGDETEYLRILFMLICVALKLIYSLRVL